MSDNTIKTQNPKILSTKIGTNTKGEKTKIVIFDSPDDFIWYAIISVRKK